jgi:hypothetical protein
MIQLVICAKESASVVSGGARRLKKGGADSRSRGAARIEHQARSSISFSRNVWRAAFNAGDICRIISDDELPANAT